MVHISYPSCLIPDPNFVLRSVPQKGLICYPDFHYSTASCHQLLITQNLTQEDTLVPFGTAILYEAKAGKSLGMRLEKCMGMRPLPIPNI